MNSVVNELETDMMKMIIFFPVNKNKQKATTKSAFESPCFQWFGEYGFFPLLFIEREICAVLTLCNLELNRNRFNFLKRTTKIHPFINPSVHLKRIVLWADFSRREYEDNDSLGFRTTKNTEESTGPLARPFACSTLFILLKRSAVLIRSLTHSWARGKVNDWMLEN